MTTETECSCECHGSTEKNAWLWCIHCHEHFGTCAKCGVWADVGGADSLCLDHGEEFRAELGYPPSDPEDMAEIIAFRSNPNSLSYRNES